MKIAGYEYQSCFGPYIQQFLQEKRDAGFIYESEEWIMQSKGRKDRMVYLSEDLTDLLREYVFKLSSVFLCQSVWFFPARNPEQQLSNVTIDKRFRDSWAKTPFAKNCERNPTVHCLRHYVECFKMVSDSKSAYFSRYSPKITHHFSSYYR